MNADLDYLAELFEPVGNVRIRRMFGGLGFFRDGLMFGIWQDDVIYLKVDDTTRATFEAEGCGPFVYGTKNGRAWRSVTTECPSACSMRRMNSGTGRWRRSTWPSGQTPPSR